MLVKLNHLILKATWNSHFSSSLSLFPSVYDLECFCVSGVLFKEKQLELVALDFYLLN